MSSFGGGWTRIAKTSEFEVGKEIDWTDILQNLNGPYLNEDGVNMFISSKVVLDSSYFNFYSLLYSFSNSSFYSVLLDDSKSLYSLTTASNTTLLKIHNSGGVSPLYSTSTTNNGVMLLLGNKYDTMDNSFPCYYPSVDGNGCSYWQSGDTGSTSMAFYVGTTSACNTTSKTVESALWGNMTCYSNTLGTGGGFGGYTMKRSNNHLLSSIPSSDVSFVNSGYASSQVGWAIYIREGINIYIYISL